MLGPHPQPPGGTECSTNVALRVSPLTMKLQSYTAPAQIPREASALLNRRKQTHFLSSKLHKSHSPQESFFLSFVFLKMDFKRGNHWHCPSNLTKVGQKPKIFYIKDKEERIFRGK